MRRIIKKNATPRLTLEALRCEIQEPGRRVADLEDLRAAQVEEADAPTVSLSELAKEYGLTLKDLVQFEQRMEQKIAATQKSGTIKRFSGDLEKDLASALLRKAHRCQKNEVVTEIAATHASRRRTPRFDE